MGKRRRGNREAAREPDRRGKGKTNGARVPQTGAKGEGKGTQRRDAGVSGGRDGEKGARRESIVWLGNSKASVSIQFV